MGDQKVNDFLLSVVLVLTDTSADFEPIGKIVAQLNEQYDYWEVILVYNGRPGDSNPLKSELSSLRNVRLISVMNNSGYYRLRSIGASQAIGDVVIISTPEEVGGIDFIGVSRAAKDDNELIMVSHSPEFDVFHMPRQFLSGLTGYRMQNTDTHTIILPRQSLNQILELPTCDLDLRFERIKAQQGRRRVQIKNGTVVSRPKDHFLQRFTILSDLITSSAPRVLGAVAFSSAIVAGISVLYTLYAVILYFSPYEVQEGWLTISLVLGLTSFFLSCAIGALSLGMVSILDKIEGGAQDAMFEEFTNTDLFKSATELNVELIDDTIKSGSKKSK